MAFSAFVLAVIFVSVSFIEYAQCECPELDEIGKKVKEKVPENNLDKVFAVNFKNKKDLAKAVEAGSKNLYKKLGLKKNETVVREVDADDKNFGNDTLNKGLIFNVYIHSMSKGLRELKLVNASNIDDLVKKFAEEINKVADELKGGEDVSITFISVTDAVAITYKYIGVKTQEDMDVMNRYYLEGMDNCKEKNSGDGS